jgi:hypothetical protein
MSSMARIRLYWELPLSKGDFIGFVLRTYYCQVRLWPSALEVQTFFGSLHNSILGFWQNTGFGSWCVPTLQALLTFRTSLASDGCVLFRVKDISILLFRTPFLSPLFLSDPRGHLNLFKSSLGDEQVRSASGTWNFQYWGC